MGKSLAQSKSGAGLWWQINVEHVARSFKATISSNAKAPTPLFRKYTIRKGPFLSVVMLA
jgi:hypothetical protein